MANRYDLLRRLAIALSRPGVDGVLGTPDIIEDLAILGLLENSPTQRVIISSSRFAHGGYGVSEPDFELMFIAIRDTFRELIGDAWTPAMETAWAGLLAEITSVQ